MKTDQSDQLGYGCELGQPATSPDGHDANSDRSTKIARILLALSSDGGLNRFQAEHFGDHCLNTTVATLRSAGYVITDEWEKVPTRFGQAVRVKRYRAAHG